MSPTRVINVAIPSESSSRSIRSRHVQCQIFFHYAAAHRAGVLAAVAGIKNNYCKWARSCWRLRGFFDSLLGARVPQPGETPSRQRTQSSTTGPPTPALFPKRSFHFSSRRKNFSP